MSKEDRADRPTELGTTTDSFNRSEIIGEIRNKGKQNTSSKRRGFLGAFAATAATVGFTGVASAVDPSGEIEYSRQMQNVHRSYESDTAAREAIETYGEYLLNHLVEQGYIENPDISEFSGGPEVATFDRDGEIVANVEVWKPVEEGRLHVITEPEAKRQYAILSRDDELNTISSDTESNDVLVMDASDGDGVTVEPQSTTLSCYCIGGGDFFCGCTEKNVVCDLRSQSCYTYTCNSATASCCCGPDSRNCCEACFSTIYC